MRLKSFCSQNACGAIVLLWTNRRNDMTTFTSKDDILMFGYLTFDNIINGTVQHS